MLTGAGRMAIGSPGERRRDRYRDRMLG